MNNNYQNIAMRNFLSYHSICTELKLLEFSLFFYLVQIRFVELKLFQLIYSGTDVSCEFFLFGIFETLVSKRSDDANNQTHVKAVRKRESSFLTRPSEEMEKLIIKV
ncbi:hypothetical protein BpHYR1_040218 [Brachionus plicatilis]|uniref:Uncharacterized protein n=1 Tax=Brachionus plicatilis TaxID=10195 RepID=A0A3M7S1A8_BRAPC|nr:hypothetical protein BpHYR1_040218 [Brachionus plicatilis]